MCSVLIQSQVRFVIIVPDIGQQLEGFQILLSNTSLFDQTISFMDNSSHVSSAYTVEVHNQLARFIKVLRPGVLTICEVSIQEGGSMKNILSSCCFLFALLKKHRLMFYILRFLELKRTPFKIAMQVVS